MRRVDHFTNAKLKAMKTNNLRQKKLSRCIGFSRMTAFVVAIRIVTVASDGAAVTQMYFDTGRFLMTRGNGSPLNAGSFNVNHDGTVVQIGYFLDVGAGMSEWVSLTGEGSANTAFADSTIGDSYLFGAFSGMFADEFLFTAGSAETGQSFPMEGTPLAVRFFSGLSIAQSGTYQILSNPSWLWKTPRETPDFPVVSMSLEDAGTKRLFNRDLPTDGFIPLDQGVLLPEPTLFAFLGIGTIALIGRRQQRRY